MYLGRTKNLVCSLCTRPAPPVTLCDSREKSWHQLAILQVLVLASSIISAPTARFDVGWFSMCAVDATAEVVRSVPRYNYRHQFGDSDELIGELTRMLLDGHYVLSKEVSTFESAFAHYCGCTYAKGVNTGTDALVIALRALGIGNGDEVIAPANTFHATVAAIELAGATPVLVDADEESFLLDQSQLSASLGSRTRAIVPVHLFGKPVRMREVMAIAEKMGLLVIEDAAQAHGASIDGRRVGSWGAAGCFSFHPSKNLAAAGDAGAIVSRDENLARQIDLQRSLGQAAQNEHVVVGLNSKLDALQARILSWKLGRLDSWNESRARIASWYRSELGGLPVQFQSRDSGEVHVYHLFQMRTQHRDALLAFLRARGIDAVVRYPAPIHLQRAFRKWGWQPGAYPVAERLSKELLCLPIRPDMEEAEVGFVIDGVFAFFDESYSAVRR